jgi:hypothetical protein
MIEPMNVYVDPRKIPLNPPLEKGDLNEGSFYPAFLKGGKGGFFVTVKPIKDPAR